MLRLLGKWESEWRGGQCCHCDRDRSSKALLKALKMREKISCLKMNGIRSWEMFGRSMKSQLPIFYSGFSQGKLNIGVRERGREGGRPPKGLSK